MLDAEKGYAIVYCQDPWGTVVEVCSHPYTQMWADRPVGLGPVVAGRRRAPATTGVSGGQQRAQPGELLGLWWNWPPSWSLYG